MQRERGFALISSLLILLVLAVLGAGAMFVANLNLGVAENSRTHAIAYANAEGGLEAAIVSLSVIYHGASPKSFPATLVTSDIVSLAGMNFEVASYTVFDAESARIAIRGIGPRGAEYVSEALLVMEDADVDPIYSRGLVSEQSINISGGSGTFIDAGMHTNSGLTLSGWKFDSFRQCGTERDSTTGRCPQQFLNTYVEGKEPLSVWVGGGAECDASKDFCEDVGKGSDKRSVVKERYLVTDEVTVNVDYDDRRFRAAGGEIDSDGSVTSVGAISRDGIIQYFSPACMAANILCLTGDQTLRPEEVQGKTVVTNGAISIECSGCTLQDTVLISTQGAVDLGNVATATDVRVFSEKSLDASGTQWWGQSTIASAENIEISGGASHLFQGFHGSATVGIAVIAEGDVQVNGGGGTEAVGVFIVGGDFKWDGGGNTYIFGGVMVKGSVDINGGYTIDAGNPIANPELDTGDRFATVVSRR